MAKQLDAILSLLCEAESQLDYDTEIDEEPLFFDNNLYISIKETRQVLKFKIIKNYNSVFFIYDGIFGSFGVMTDMLFRADKILVPFIAFASVKCDESLVRFMREDESITRIAENEMSKSWILRKDGIYPIWMDDRKGGWIIEVFDTDSLSTTISDD
jgi:hypothetical protein